MLVVIKYISTKFALTKVVYTFLYKLLLIKPSVVLSQKSKVSQPNTLFHIPQNAKQYLCGGKLWIAAY